MHILSTWKSRWLGVVLLGLLLFSAACSPEPRPLVFGEPVWGDGEVSVYRAVDRSGNVVGGVRYEIHAGGEHVDADGWTIRREVTDMSAQETAVIEVTGKGYLPVHVTLVRADGNGQEQVETAILKSNADLTLTDRLGNVTYQRINVPSDIRDERTLPVIVRALPLADRYLTRLNSFLPVVGVYERVTVQVKGQEEVTVPAGTFRAWKVVLETNSRSSTLWIGVDPPHPTVKIEDGRSRATFELVDFVPGE